MDRHAAGQGPRGSTRGQAMKFQRILGPVFFIVIMAAFIVCAVATDRGRSLANPVVISRLAAVSARSPLLSLLALLIGLPLSGSFLLMPESLVCALSAARLGPVAGTLFSVLVLLLTLLFFYALARSLLRDDLCELIRGPLERRGLAAPLSVETCLLLEVLLLAAPVVAVPATGVILGLTDIRPKAFALAAIPLLFARAAVGALAGTPAPWYAILLITVLGVFLLALFVLWLGTLLAARLRADAESETAPPPVPRTRRRGAAPEQAVQTAHAGQTERDGAPGQGQAAKLSGNQRETGPDAVAARLRRETLVVIVRDTICQDPDIVELLRREAERLGLRTRTWDLIPRVGAEPPRGGLPELVEPSLPVPPAGSPGAAGHDSGRVDDLDGLFMRGFGEGASAVIAVRAMSPLARAGLLRRALSALARASVVIGPASGHNVLLLALRRETRDASGVMRAYEVGTLSGRAFEGDLARALARFCPRPELLPELPVAGELTKPLVSVIVRAASAAPRALATVKSAAGGPWTECLVPDAGESESTRALLTGAGATVLAGQGTVAERLNAAVRAARGQILLFVQAGSQLPEGFDQAAWETLARKDCVLGAFSLPTDIALPRRGMQWVGAILRLSSLGLPVPAQGVFLRRERYDAVGGFTDEGDGRSCVTTLIERVAAHGRVILHNDRVVILPGGDSVDAGGAVKEAEGMLPRLRDRAGLVLRELATRAASPFRKDAETGGAPGESVSSSESGQGTGLVALAKKSLPAWRGFMCRSGRGDSPLGMDDTTIVGLLRERYAAAHGGVEARPARGAALMGRLSPLVARLAAPGENLLLDNDFCFSFPRTAAALTRLAQDAGYGVLFTDTGARMADLGMAADAARRVLALSRVMERVGVTLLLTVSPLAHEYLARLGLPVLPVYDRLRHWGVRLNIDAEGLDILAHSADSAHADFSAALAPYLQGGAVLPGHAGCCGAGGDAASADPDMAARVTGEVRMRGRPVITTCTQCAVTLDDAGCVAIHPLAVLTGTRERPASGLERLRGLGYLLSVLRSPLTPIGMPEPAVAEPVIVTDGPAADAARESMPAAAVDSRAGAASAGSVPDVEEATKADSLDLLDLGTPADEPLRAPGHAATPERNGSEPLSFGETPASWLDAPDGAAPADASTTDLDPAGFVPVEKTLPPLLEHETEPNPGRAPGGAAEAMPEESPGVVPEDVPVRMPETTLDTILGDVPASMPGKDTDGVPGDTFPGDASATSCAPESPSGSAGVEEVAPRIETVASVAVAAPVEASVDAGIGETPEPRIIQDARTVGPAMEAGDAPALLSGSTAEDEPVAVAPQTEPAPARRATNLVALLEACDDEPGEPATVAGDLAHELDDGDAASDDRPVFDLDLSDLVDLSAPTSGSAGRPGQPANPFNFDLDAPLSLDPDPDGAGKGRRDR